MSELVSRGHVTFDESCPQEFEDLVRETLETSDFIETVTETEDGNGPLVITEVVDAE